MNPRLAHLKDRHVGERGVIVANGPSLNQMDLSFLRNETVIGMNKIFLGLKRFGFYPKYYIAINPIVVEQSVTQIRQLNCIKVLSKNAASDQVPEGSMTYLVDTKAHDCNELGKPCPGFSRDLATNLMHEGWTVTHAALQLAYHLGFEEVVLIGLDHRYQFEGAPNEKMTMDGPDQNHFDPSYFGGGQSWHNPDLAQSEESYRLAESVFQASGRRIIDATVGGACQIFPKQDYRDYFGLKI